MTDMKISPTAIYWNARIAESRKGNFLVFLVIRKLQERG